MIVFIALFRPKLIPGTETTAVVDQHLRILFAKGRWTIDDLQNSESGGFYDPLDHQTWMDQSSFSIENDIKPIVMYGFLKVVYSLFFTEDFLKEFGTSKEVSSLKNESFDPKKPKYCLPYTNGCFAS